MKKTILAVCTVVCCAMALQVTAQTEAEMKARMDFMTPGLFIKPFTLINN